MRIFFAIVAGKIIYNLSNFFNLGSGSTWPGHFGIKLDNNLIKKIFSRNKETKIVLVAGTNGKTTTTSLLAHIFKEFGFRVFYNQEGANLLNGIASSIIRYGDIFGKLKYDYAIFEVDEFSLPLVLSQITPDALVILNLFRDQLDRYGEVNTIGMRWFSALKKLPRDRLLVINGDDPYLYFSSINLQCQKKYFGVSEKLMELKDLPHDIDFNYCPSCNSLLEYQGISYAHLGNYLCKVCGFKRGEIEDFSNTKINYPMEGLYNVYNTNATLTLIKTLIGGPLKKINSFLSNFPPAFGRQEEIVYKNKKIFMILSKNPAGFNQSIKTVVSMIENKKANFLILLNDRIPDGKDVSWIWDIDFRQIINKAKNITVSGDRVYDMYLRIKYEGGKKISAIENLREALEKSFEKTQKREKLYILATYSAMLDARKILVGRKLL